MRMHIQIDDDLVARIDQLSGQRGRSAFVRSAIEEAVRQRLRWTNIEAAAGGIEDGGHEWDADPGSWVRGQRRAAGRRAG